MTADEYKKEVNHLPAAHQNPRWNDPYNLDTF